MPTKKPKNTNTYISELAKKKTCTTKLQKKYKQCAKTSKNEDYRKRAEKQSGNIADCYDRLWLEIHRHKQYMTTGLEQQKSRPFATCKNRFCNCCCFIKSKKTYSKTINALEAMKADGINYQGFHLTLTIKNPTIEKYADEYEKMNKAFHTFIHKFPLFKKYPELLVGYQAGRETTQSPNAKTANELHPHIHILLLLDLAKYDLTITDDEFGAYWIERCAYYGIIANEYKMDEIYSNELNNDGIPVDPYIKAISEVAKYSAKPQEVIAMDNTHFEVLDTVLTGKRQYSYGGKLKKYLSKAKESEVIKEEEFVLWEVLMLDFEKKSYNVKKLTEKEQQRYLLDIEQKKETEKLYNQKLRDDATNFLRSLRTKKE